MAEELQLQYEKIDNLRCEGIKTAEKSCRKLRMGEVPWFPEFQKATDKIRLWQGLLKQAQGKKISIKYNLRLQAKVGIKIDRHLTKDEIIQKLKLAFQEHRNTAQKGKIRRTVEKL